MGTLILLQVALNLAFIATITVLWVDRIRLKTQDNPRLSRGLQLLSSKIAILQDLMDRTDNTGKHLVQLLEAKQADIQETLEEVERHLHKVNESIEKSKDVARLFRDKIPHEEIIERQNSAKYIKAAKLANQGLSLEEISNQVSIPKGELELIIKLNSQNLMVQSQPAWLEEEDIKEIKTIEAPASPILEEADSKPAMPPMEPSVVAPPVPQVATPAVSKKTMIYSSRRLGGGEQEESSIRPVVFKKITTENNYS